MPMNIEDVDVLAAERDAEPERFRSLDPTDSFTPQYERLHASRQQSARSAGLEKPHKKGVEEEEEAPIDQTRASSCASSSSLSRRPTELSRNASTATGYTTNLEDKFMHYLDRHPTAIQRMEQHRLQHSATVGSSRPSNRQLPDFGGSKPYPPPLPDREEYVVEFCGHDDPRHAQNWPSKKKIINAAIVIWLSLGATFASSIFSAASYQVMEVFHIGQEVATLGTSLFVLGYVFGPIIWGPFSELYGRRLPVIIGAFGFALFNFAVAVAKDLQQVMICRFFAGIFGSCALALSPAIMADIFNNQTRGLGIAAFSATVMIGPLCAPFIGGFITKSYLHWRWTCYLPGIMGASACILAVFFLEESYPPVILVAKAAELRRLTKNWGIHAKQEEVEVDLKELATKNISRPLRILFTEMIVLLVTFYMSFVYGLLYLSLTAFAIVFGEIHGFSHGVSGLPYFGMVIGVATAFGYICWDNKGYVRKLQANNNIPVPEWRLPAAMIGGLSFTIGLFWFGWTGYTKSIPWIVPTIAGFFIGAGIYLIFLQCLNYIIDAYLMFAASASAANTMMRSLFGAVFPLFAALMFNGIGVQWGMTFLGCLAALFMPMPFLFFFYGKKIRAKSKIAPAPDLAQDKRRDEESRGASDTSNSEKEEKDA